MGSCPDPFGAKMPARPASGSSARDSLRSPQGTSPPAPGVPLSCFMRCCPYHIGSMMMTMMERTRICIAASGRSSRRWIRSRFQHGAEILATGFAAELTITLGHLKRRSLSCSQTGENPLRAAVATHVASTPATNTPCAYRSRGSRLSLQLLRAALCCPFKPSPTWARSVGMQSCRCKIACTNARDKAMSARDAARMG